MGKEHIKDVILAKARELIKEQGGFTIKELTDATHVNIAAVNYHFGSKDQLTKVIIDDVISDLKAVLTFYMYKLERGMKIDDFLKDIVNGIYDFTVENAGLLKYLFYSFDREELTTSELINAFFSDNEFTKLVYEHVAKLVDSDNPKEIYARYTIFFATGAAPMLLQLMQGKKGLSATFNDEEFKNYYVQQMMKLLN